MASVEKSCIDVFSAEMVRGARHGGCYEFPVVFLIERCYNG